ncbi:hypothetical protein N7478_010900 [Penicillium angulare]|uniref:uncharacterized protein n=1 Tax=Penicillium angulare TaxID=116970 RepID=UPI00253F7ADC|nr:uncharacterized protein N7478_010900 [Penicillium angulare]KAJ5263295.1 hypothetical protein N7478_010900 [Penicillium angulare]
MNDDTPYIPEKDPNHPRWLLNIDTWEVFPYEAVKDEVASNGYGIVSYTWGMWSDFNKEAPGRPKYRVNRTAEPEDLPWKIPTIEKIELSHAKRIMRKCLDDSIAYVWWDWMCVPQGKRDTAITLIEKLEKVKGDEIAKQMQIYQEAKEGFIWLHRTNWDKPNSLELQKYLELGFKPQPTFADTLCEFRLSMRSIQEQEPWLTSGWTLQEGVLLQKSKLMDHEGEPLPGDFMSDGPAPPERFALVENLSVPATGLADEIATALIRYSEGWTSSSVKKMPQGVSERVKQALTYFGPKLEDGQHSHAYQHTASTFTNLIRCGLVAYWPGKATVLYILSGAASRRFAGLEDKCWALIGALKLEGLDPWYSNKETKEGKEKDFRKIKEQFFGPLLKKYQWELFIVPKVEDPDYETLAWFERIVHGGVLPLSLFLVDDPYDNLPKLDYDATKDEIICTLESSGCASDLTGSTSDSTKRNFIQLKQDVFVRHYRQKRLDPIDADSPRGFIEVDEIKLEKRSGLIYLPVMEIRVPDASQLNLGDGWRSVEEAERKKDAEKRENAERRKKNEKEKRLENGPGLRCAAFNLVGGGETTGYFEGIVDLWGLPGAFEDITSYTDFRICGSKTKPLAEESGRCVMA